MQPMQPATIVVAPLPPFGENPVQVTCGNCRQTVMTTTIAENGACAWLAAAIVCFIFCPCAWVPLVMDSCKDVHHTCPACGARLGTYKRL